MMHNLENIVLLGDVHGEWKLVNAICRKFKDKIVLGIGDIGIGFDNHKIPILPSNFCFFRGNHDNPKLSKVNPKYTVDYGMWNGLYIVAGGDSVDKKMRVENLDWWSDEQLSREDMEKVLDDYCKVKPNILVCHEAPFRFHNLLCSAAVLDVPDRVRWGIPRGNSTAFLLDSMIQYHMPDYLFFGHWHVSVSGKYNNCQYRCLNIGETFELGRISLV